MTKWRATVHLWHLKVKWYYFGQCGYKSSLRDKVYWKSPNLTFKERKHLLNFDTLSKTRADMNGHADEEKFLTSTKSATFFIL